MIYLLLSNMIKHAVELIHIFYLKILFFTMLMMYSAFVLTSVSTEYYEQNLGRIFEYYVYFWGAGDFIEEVICCFVSNCGKIILISGLRIMKQSKT